MAVDQIESGIAAAVSDAYENAAQIAEELQTHDPEDSEGDQICRACANAIRAAREGTHPSEAG